VSVCCRGSRVYVANVNDPANNVPSTIARFNIGSDGTLSSGGAAHQLSGANARPSQVSFAPDGSAILVTERGTNLISTFHVNADGSLGNPSTVASPRPDPFGFAFGVSNRLIVSEAAAMDPLGSSASSYFLTAGVPSVVSSGVLNGQMASCWVSVSGDGRQAFVSNFGSNTVTNYRVALDGSLTLQQQAVATDGAGSAPIDSGFGRNHFVQLLGGKGTITTYSVASNGDLALIGTQATGLPAMGSQGIAVRD
jgi:6-phosphogluconolactonase (cycloisomerase 2 family)